MDTVVYYVSVEDAIGCTANDNIVVNVNPSFAVSAGLDQLICYGDTSQVFMIVDSLNTGLSPYTYSWKTIMGLNNYISDSTVFDPYVSALDTMLLAEVLQMVVTVLQMILFGSMLILNLF